MIEYREEKRHLEKVINLFTKYREEIEKVVGSVKYEEEREEFERRYYKLAGHSYNNRIFVQHH